jgi:signal transduction histidine kinase
MTLTSRLSLFFLTALALVLAGFSGTLYLLGQRYLSRQAEDRLEFALNTLVAAAEVGPDGVVWEPSERQMSLGPDTESPVSWLVRDDQGRRVNGSPEPLPVEFLVEAAAALGPDIPAVKAIDAQGHAWRVSQRRVAAGPLRNPSEGRLERPPEPGEVKYPALIVTAAVPLEPVAAALRALAGILAGVSLIIWLVAGIAGRALCRRALRPVTRMAQAARTMGADPARRLPTGDSKDELTDLGQAFNGLLDRLYESYERQRRFTGDASHQLRTPLTAMLGQVEVALRRDRTPEEYRQVMNSVRRQAEHLRGVVEMLLFLARADAEARLPHLERIDLVPWLAGHLASWSGHARAADLRLGSSPGVPLPVDAQTPLLGQLVDVLLENACKYSPTGSPITIRVWRESAAVCLAVEDRGHGIAAEDLPHVFEPFFRSAETRRRGLGGVGLGLAIAERIATALSGSIHVISTPGVGSCFTLRLPAASETAGSEDERKQSLQGVGPGSPSQGHPAARPRDPGRI